MDMSVAEWWRAMRLFEENPGDYGSFGIYWRIADDEDIPNRLAGPRGRSRATAHGAAIRARRHDAPYGQHEASSAHRGPSSRASLGRNRSPEFAFGVKVAIYFSNFAASSEPPVTLPAE